MRISVTVIPKASRNVVEEINSGVYKVKTTVAAEKGKANERVIELLAEYFAVKKSAVELISGEIQRKKIYEIET